jgi:hypothetical protein
MLLRPEYSANYEGTASFPLWSGVNDDLQLINILLAHKRLDGRDHGGPEAVPDGGTMFQGAALLTGLGVNKDSGQMEEFHVLAVNQHVHDDDPKKHRCAETQALGAALQHYDDVKISRCDFMGGLSTLDKTQTKTSFFVAKEHEGSRVPCCGSCCDVLKKYATPDMKVRIFPLNNGKMEVEHDTIGADIDHAPNVAASNEVWEIAMRHLIGKEVVLAPDQRQGHVRAAEVLNYLDTPDAPNRLRAVMDAGTVVDAGHYLTQQLSETDTRNHTAALERGVDKQHLLSEIQKFMMEYIHMQATAPNTKLQRATVAVLRSVDEKGKLYYRCGFHLEGKKNGKDIQSSHNAIDSAISNYTTQQRGNESLTDVFYIDLHRGELEAMASHRAPVTARVPSGGENTVMAKAIGRNSTLPEGDNVTFLPRETYDSLGAGEKIAAKVHVFMPALPMNAQHQIDTDGLHFNAERDVATLRLNEMIRYGFSGKHTAKATPQNGRA